MLYYMNSDTGKVIAREVGDEPFGDLWFEIDEAEYQEALHPLTPANTACSGRLVRPAYDYAEAQRAAGHSWLVGSTRRR